jgi:hypothetical protein
MEERGRGQEGETIEQFGSLGEVKGRLYLFTFDLSWQAVVKQYFGHKIGGI